VFCAPVIGPLGKDEFLAAFSSFKLQEGFPDASANFHYFRVDPFQPNRVWLGLCRCRAPQCTPTKP
jgi:hypothetical protein